MRVYELAEELDVESSDLMETLESEFDLELSSHMSGVDEDTASLVRELYRETGEDGDTDGDDSSSDEAEVEDEKSGVEEAPEPESTSGAGEEHEEAARVTVRGEMSPAELAGQLDADPSEVVGSLVEAGMMVEANQPVDPDALEVIADELGFELVHAEEEVSRDGREDHGVDLEGVPEEERQSRPPVLTVMGHVDHGKTQLLDTIRRTDVRASESGGITQHIGAYEVETPEGNFVFIDTPGHEAFTAMRARGANVTDLVILVVAADDGVMPQTVESINHARAAGVEMIVAINKMDLPEADADRVRQGLTEHELIPESWGGDTICVEVSALEDEGIDELLEMVDLQAEMMELQTSRNLPVRGTVIEAEMQKGRGPTATVLVQQGELTAGTPFVAGTTWGSVRALIDSHGDRVQTVEPGLPVRVTGFEELPQPGDSFEAMESQSEARDLASRRHDEQQRAGQETQGKVTMEELEAFIEQGKIKDLNLLIKADARGSTEVLQDAFESLESDEVDVQVIHTGVGDINESDVMLADASDAMIIGFNVSTDGRAGQKASEKGIEVRTFDVVYEAIETVRAAMEGMLEPEIEEETIGRLEVREIFDIPGSGRIAGCYVQEGEITRNAGARVVRDGVLVHDGDVASLKRFKEDVQSVSEGYECGVGLENFNEVEIGDTLEVYEEREVAATLS